jgi:hypothetical protein
MSLKSIISEICEIEVGLYLDYYNGKIKSYKGFNQKLESHKKYIIEKVYDLMEQDYTEKDIIAAIKEQGVFYKESPEWFGEDDDSSNYPSEYYETKKNEKYPFNEKCGKTLSLVKGLFKARKSVKVGLSLKDKLEEEGIRELIVSHIDSPKSKKYKSKRKSKRRKSKRRKSKKKKSKR